MKKGKKLLLLLSTVVMLLLMTTSVFAVSYKAGGFVDDSGKVQWTLDYDGNLNIFGTGPINKTPFETYKNEIKTITIGEGITKTCRRMAVSYKNLYKVNLPSTLEEIDMASFEFCTALTQINLPKKLKIINHDAFSGCSSLASITFPNSLEIIEAEAFRLAGLSGKIELPKSLQKIGGGAFSYNNLEEVYIDGNKIVINPYAFSYCYNLKSVHIGTGITEIKNHVFYNCERLQNVYFSEGLTFIDKGAFYNCKSIRTLAFPDSLESIDSSETFKAFGYCASLQSIDFGSGLSKISNYTFLGCTALKNITFSGDAPKFDGTSIFDPKAVIQAKYPNLKSWLPSLLNSHGAAYINWETWTPPISHFRPTLTSVTNVADGVNIKWSKLAGATKYEIQRKLGNGSWKTIKTVSSRSTSFKDKSVSDCNFYTYRLYAYSGNTKSKLSRNKQTFYVAKNVLTSVTSGRGKATLKWKKNKNITYYQIEYSTKSNFANSKKFVCKASSNNVTKTFAKGKTYYFRIRNVKVINGKWYVSIGDVKTRYPYLSQKV